MRRSKSGWTVSTAAAVSMSLLATSPGFAQSGPNSGSSVTPPTATIRDTSGFDQQTANAFAAECTQQLDLFNFVTGALGLATQAGGLVAEAAGAIEPSGVAEAIAIGIQGGGLASSAAAFGAGATAYFRGIPDCNGSFLGGAEFIDGGIRVDGQSQFDADVGVNGRLTANSISSNSLTTTQGIAAYNGAITLGDRGLNSYYNGITIGGGEIAGAGTGGLDAETASTSAIAIGNGSAALADFSTALGNSARAVAAGGTAVGANKSGIGSRRHRGRSFQHRKWAWAARRSAPARSPAAPRPPRSARRV